MAGGQIAEVECPQCSTMLARELSPLPCNPVLRCEPAVNPPFLGAEPKGKAAPCGAPAEGKPIA